MQKIKDDKYEIISCHVKIDKICIHITLKFANYGGEYLATAFKCSAQIKAQAKTKKKFQKFQSKNKQPAIYLASKKESATEPLEKELNTGIIFQIKSLKPQSFELSLYKEHMSKKFINIK